MGPSFSSVLKHHIISILTNARITDCTLCFADHQFVIDLNIRIHYSMIFIIRSFKSLNEFEHDGNSI